MSHKIFRSILLVAAAVLLASLLIIMSYLYEYFAGVQERQLGDELSLAAAGVENYGESYLQTVKPGDYRITWIAADGTVMYDTIRPDTPEENHAGREEVKRALETGEGRSTRYSTTLLEKTIYYARRLTDGSVLRMSISGATTGYLALGVVQPALLVFVLALILSSFLARRISNRIVEPLNHLDLDHPLDNAAAYAELSPLLRRIHEQRVENAAQLRALRQKTDEFNQTIGSMKEGLVLLDENERVLSINAAAKDVFAVNDDCMGRDFLTIDRDPDMTHALGKARADGHAEIRRAHRGRMYQFDISRIESSGAPIGTVLLAFDITEREYAERNRREFTANVSHELKTPLQGIIGSAELIENGMVQPQDVPRFVEHIHSEASRMVTLIGDIIRLSQLDEGDVMPPRGRGRAGRGEGSRFEPFGRSREARNHHDGGRNARHRARRAPPDFRNRVQPVRKRREIQPRRRQRFCEGGNRGRKRGADRAGYRHRHSGRGPEPRVRALLPRGQEPFQGLRRHGTGAVHRQARGDVSPRKG